MNPDSQGAHAKESSTMSVRQLLRQQRELEEKRKFGLAPLAVDCATQQEISPNVPQSISQAPWFYGAAGPTLEHQRQRGSLSDDVFHDQPTRVTVMGKATKYVAGACKNCGSRTHKAHECTQARKKVGAKYSGKVTGTDLMVQQLTQSYAQKRDRYVGDVGVDLMKQAYQEEASSPSTSTTQQQLLLQDQAKPLCAVGAEPHKRHKVDGVFRSLTSQHGGVEIKELPKYLHNIDSQDHILFDPKTGSMRGNPNDKSSSHTFRGDLERYRSGDYYHYIESQYRFLTGESKSFVDFAYDAKLSGLETHAAPARTEERALASPAGGASAIDDMLVQSLYGHAHAASPLVGNVTDTLLTPLTPESRKAETVQAGQNVPHGAGTVLARRIPKQQEITAGHQFVYGSYFCLTLFQWGYKCCKGVGYDAPACTRQ